MDGRVDGDRSTLGGVETVVAALQGFVAAAVVRFRRVWGRKAANYVPPPYLEFRRPRLTTN